MDDLFTEADPVRVVRADSLVRLRRIPAGVFDAVASDPPYGLEFMGKKWDGADGFRRSLNRNDSGRENVFGWTSRKGPEYRAGNLFQEWCHAWGTELVRVLKPGGYAVVFGGTRTYHRLTCALEDAGFEIRDCLMWLYGSGFPKHKACLKPAYEPILLCRRQGPKSMPLGIDECRVKLNGEVVHTPSSDPGKRSGVVGTDMGISRAAKNKFREAQRESVERTNSLGRYPANILHDGIPGEIMRYFYTAKANRKEKEHGLEQHATKRYGMSGGAQQALRDGTDPGGQGIGLNRVREVRNTHPTVKPVSLMRWLVRLVCPKGGLVLDPFAGSGTTGVACVKEGRRCLLIEKDRTYAEIARARVAKAVCVRRQRPDLGVV